MVNTSLGQCRALLARQQMLQQQQQRRLARRLHDGLSQQLTLLSLQLSIAQMDSNPPANWPSTCGRWSALILELGQNLRQIMNELQPRIADDFGLSDALTWFAKSTTGSVQVELALPENPVSLPAPVANEIYSVCCDVVNELFAPQGVTDATVSVEESDEFVRLRLFTTEKHSTLVLATPRKLEELLVHDRLFCLNGTVDVSPLGSQSFSITLTVPSQRECVPHAA
jgi:signal transduction histidine kinase